MDLPTHQNSPQAFRTASTSYNFVPLPEIVVHTVKDSDKDFSGQDSFHLARKTGC